ncbi:hypothetical protein T12_4386 [Trichinella patagoniensis]|uniref:Uncharacterized protein n=1 Tax=Trichinella patagoniensis TaxID=990121 RepID=A0A0V1AB27_9BILA|nr:hypothetical protein T12_4386 [Trichinella patagoniensis]
MDPIQPHIIDICFLGTKTFVLETTKRVSNTICLSRSPTILIIWFCDTSFCGGVNWLGNIVRKKRDEQLCEHW